MVFSLSSKTQRFIPWPLLIAQFGADYGRERAFKEAFIYALRKVLTVYPGAKVAPVQQGLQLKPSRSLSVLTSEPSNFLARPLKKNPIMFVLLSVT
jgi:hypothetical protein